MGPEIASPLAPIAARILSSNAGERGPRMNAKCGNKSISSLDHLSIFIKWSHSTRISHRNVIWRFGTCHRLVTGSSFDDLRLSISCSKVITELPYGREKQERRSRWNTLGCLDQYTCNMLRLWNSRDRETVYIYEYMQKMETVKQSGPWNSLGTHGSLVVMRWLCISSRVKPENLTF